MMMKLQLIPKNVRGLYPTDILFQTEYWARVKTCLGWKPYAFDIGGDFSRRDMLLLVKSLGRGVSVAYVPQGPEFAPPPERYGPYLEALSKAVADQMDSSVVFIRYDLPWESPYADELAENPERELPEARIREIRMNFGTRNWNIRKTPMDMTVADTYIVDIGCREDEIRSRMKSKTRYNIGLARRKGVRVCEASVQQLPDFYELYCETAQRNGFHISDYRYFSALFSRREQKPVSPNMVLLLASHDKDILAGAIVSITEQGAFFLHGASSNVKQNHMGSYALHWEAIRYARFRKCRTYDMGALSPGKIARHPFFGLYRFKTGFGGRIVHRTGSWDYPLQEEAYNAFRTIEGLQNDAFLCQRGCCMI